jgi:hypothetical protein
MLYVGYEPNTEIEFDPKSIDGWIAFCEEKPENAVYDFLDAGECAAAEYFKACGQPFWNFDSKALHSLVGSEIFHALVETPWTYGALLDRLMK